MGKWSGRPGSEQKIYRAAHGRLEKDHEHVRFAQEKKQPVRRAEKQKTVRKQSERDATFTVFCLVSSRGGDSSFTSFFLLVFPLVVVNCN